METSQIGWLLFFIFFPRRILIPLGFNFHSVPWPRNCHVDSFYFVNRHHINVYVVVAALPRMLWFRFAKRWRKSTLTKTGSVGEALSTAIKIHLLSHTVRSNPCESFCQGGGYSVNYFLFNFQEWSEKNKSISVVPCTDKITTLSIHSVTRDSKQNFKTDNNERRSKRIFYFNICNFISVINLFQFLFSSSFRKYTIISQHEVTYVRAFFNTF